MTLYRKIQVQQDAYMVVCDNCGEESGPYPSPPSTGKAHYCHQCWPACHANDAFKRYKHLKGARVVGFRFNGHAEAEPVGIVLRKGGRTYEIWSPGHDDDGQNHTLAAHTALRLVDSCYVFEPRATRPRVRRVRGEER